MSINADIFSSGGGGGSGSSLSPFIVGPTKSDYSTIEAAITAAVAAGASNNAPVNIYIKPGTYNPAGGTLNMAPGINLIGFTPANYYFNYGFITPVCSVIINAIVAIPDDCSCSLNSVELIVGDNVVVFTYTLTSASSNCFLNNCSIIAGNSTGTTLISNANGLLNATIYFTGCSVVDNTDNNVIFDSTNKIGFTTLYAETSNISAEGTATMESGNGAIFEYYLQNSLVNANYDIASTDGSFFYTLTNSNGGNITFTGQANGLIGQAYNSFLAVSAIEASQGSQPLFFFNCPNASVDPASNIPIQMHNSTNANNSDVILYYFNRVENNYVATLNDRVIAIDTASGATTLYLPLSTGPIANGDGAVGFVYTFKDYTGHAATNNITINGNGLNIDGNSTATINTNYGKLSVIFAGTGSAYEWFTI